MHPVASAVLLFSAARDSGDRVFHFYGRGRLRCRQKSLPYLQHCTFEHMSDPAPLPGAPAAALPWDARLARRLVLPLRHGPLTPNHLTTVRLAFGIAAAGALMRGSYGWMNLGALLMVVSNFLDHTDGELARMSGRSSRLGHWYDLASDAAVTVLLFTGLGLGVGTHAPRVLQLPAVSLGLIAGLAVTAIFYLRMRIEAVGGKDASKQAELAGFEAEDVLYLLPLITLCNGTKPLLIAAAVGAPLFAVWVLFDYRRLTRTQSR
jgi:archaetidylinositol phosphate synthase